MVLSPEEIRISDLEKALDDTIRYLRRLPPNPMTYHAANKAEEVLLAPKIERSESRGVGAVLFAMCVPLVAVRENDSGIDLIALPGVNLNEETTRRCKEDLVRMLLAGVSIKFDTDRFSARYFNNLETDFSKGSSFGDSELPM